MKLDEERVVEPQQHLLLSLDVLRLLLTHDVSLLQHLHCRASIDAFTVS